MDRSFQRKSNVQKHLLILWAVAVLWIYVGNIINFHQHHIWGKQLLPVGITNSRTKGKSIAKYQPGNESAVKMLDSSQPFAETVHNDFLTPPGAIAIVAFLPSGPSGLSVCGHHSWSLRGPPSI